MSKSNILQKKLKAIVFTDIVDFTKISADDEHHALELINKQREILKPIVEKHNGEWLKEIGDGLLFSFDSSLDAVNCSIEIQQSLQEIDSFKIRIGIHQGDILITDGDVYGDDVNIASRVENFAPEGGIAISDKINKDISGVKDIKTSFIGYRKLKGVEQETQIRCILSHSLPYHKISVFPRLAYYMSFVFGVLILLIVVPVAVITVSRGGWNKYDKMDDVITNGDFIIMSLTEGIIFLLLGYVCLSYIKGASHKAQQFLLYFTYLFTAHYLITQIIPSYTDERLKEFTLQASLYLLLAVLIVTVPLIVSKLRKTFK